ncbi:hypothetical protein CMI38_00880 [Candidatus Pacearchaeota archaeon]|nr:hypothetical protein [Candidatus Pacearchaeota archaeon]|tara:strand:- start:2141 stop:2728 length:588 start_codon:yes stop_codon:yes gene_type:complete
MEIKKAIRVSIFIDGRNFYHEAKNLKKGGLKIRLQDIVQKLVGNRELITAFYYNTLLDRKYDPKRYESHNKFINIVKGFPKFKVVLCDWRKIIGEEGTVRYDTKGDDVQLAHDLLMGAVKDEYDTAIIVSGDADFIPILKTVREEYKKKVGNAFFRRTSSYKLRKACDFSINLNKLIRELNEKKKIRDASALSKG